MAVPSGWGHPSGGGDRSAGGRRVADARALGTRPGGRDGRERQGAPRVPPLLPIVLPKGRLSPASSGANPVLLDAVELI